MPINRLLSKTTYDPEQMREIVYAYESVLASLNLTDRSLPDSSCAQTHLAKCHATLARLDVSGLLAYRLFVTRDYAEFVWDALMEAGHDCGLAPIGMEAWRALG